MNRYGRPTLAHRALLALFFGLGCLGVAAGISSLAPADRPAYAAPPAAPAAAPPKLARTEGLTRLLQGNVRFVAGRAEHPRQTPQRRAELANVQHPFAVILGCADSRTPPEVLFDQGLGDLFIVRVAGNVIDDHALGSIEYAAEHLHAPLVVVLGHQRCGAVVAARTTIAARAHAEGHIESLVTALRPAVEATADQDVEATCKANVRNVVHALRSSEPILRHLVDDGKLTVVGAYYNLDTGAVTLLDDK